MLLKKMTKQCIVCGEFKHLSEFPTYKDRKGNKAYFNRCKSCGSIYKKQHYNNNKEAYLERSKQQKLKDPDGYKKYLKKYYLEHREERKPKDRAYYEANKERIYKYQRYWRSLPENAIKKDAWKLVQLSLKFGILVRPEICNRCGEICKPEAHHYDYHKPLEVVWLCKKCHEEVHHYLNEGASSEE